MHILLFSLKVAFLFKLPHGISVGNLLKMPENSGIFYMYILASKAPKVNIAQLFF
jgi:hypothetical protein